MKRLDAGVLAQRGQPHRGAVVDVEGDAPRQLAQRVVRQAGQVHHRVDAVEVASRDVAQVLHDDRIAGSRRRAEQGLVEIAGVEADHFVARVDDRGGEHAPDIAIGAGDQNSHSVPCGLRRASLALMVRQVMPDGTSRRGTIRSTCPSRTSRTQKRFCEASAK
jgi:hypothetical protein